MYAGPDGPTDSPPASAAPDGAYPSPDGLPSLMNQDAVTTEYVKSLVEIMDVTQKRREVLDLLIWNQVRPHPFSPSLVRPPPYRTPAPRDQAPRRARKAAHRAQPAPRGGLHQAGHAAQAHATRTPLCRRSRRARAQQQEIAWLCSCA